MTQPSAKRRSLERADRFATPRRQLPSGVVKRVGVLAIVAALCPLAAPPRAGKRSRLCLHQLRALIEGFLES